jgi:hypothetical protein
MLLCAITCGCNTLQGSRNWGRQGRRQRNIQEVTYFKSVLFLETLKSRLGGYRTKWDGQKVVGARKPDPEELSEMRSL